MLKPGGQVDGDEALEFYAKHTAQIEVKAGYTWDPGSRRGPPQWVPWAGAGIQEIGYICAPDRLKNLVGKLGYMK